MSVPTVQRQVPHFMRPLSIGLVAAGVFLSAGPSSSWLTTLPIVAAEGAPRKFVLAQDRATIPEPIVFDAEIALADVYDVFERGGDTKALIVSRELLDHVVRPPTGFDHPGGNQEY